LRIPGIGVRNVKRILQIRKYQGLRTEDLKKLRVAWNRAKVFVITADHNPALGDLDKLDLKRQVAPPTKQMMLFDAASSAASGEV
jgi:predicted DNA-binding helix-hairpin-helix protein